MPKPSLNPRQQRFVDEYIIDNNATQAYIRAGYSPNGAHVSSCQLLAKPKVSEHIAIAQQKRGERLQVKQDDVIREILDAIEVAKVGDYVLDTTQTPVVVDGERLRKPATGHVLKGAELLGRHLGMFTDKQVIEKRELADQTDEELKARLDALRKEREAIH